MNTISILGCGWLGLPLGRHLAAAGYTVKGSTTHLSKLDMLHEAGISPFHLQLTPELTSDPKDFFDAEILLINLPPRNRDGIANFHKDQLKAISKEAKDKIGHIIFISSTAVYPAENNEVNELQASSACLTRGGIPLLEMENLFVEDPSFKTTVIRFGGLYGPDRHPGRFLTGKKNLAGANSPVNMIHLDDCMGVIQTIIEQNIWGEVFNACSPSDESRQTFYERAAKNLGIAPPTFSTEEAPYKKVTSEKLMTLTGYRFKH